MQSQTKPGEFSKKQDAETEPAEGEEVQAQFGPEQEELQKSGGIARNKSATRVVSGSSLHVQYDVCLQNLDLCVEKTRYIGVGQTYRIKAKLSSVKKRLRELLLRMRIWRTEGFPSQYTNPPADTSSFSTETDIVLHPLSNNLRFL